MSCQEYGTLHPGNELSINTGFIYRVKWTSFSSVTSETVTSDRASGGGLNPSPTPGEERVPSVARFFEVSELRSVEGPNPRMIIQLVTGNCFLVSVELKESLSRRACFWKIKDLVNEP